MEVHLITIHRHSKLARVLDKMSIEIHAVLSPPRLHLSPAQIARRIVSDRISDRTSECRHNSNRVAIKTICNSSIAAYYLTWKDPMQNSKSMFSNHFLIVLYFSSSIIRCFISSLSIFNLFFIFFHAIRDSTDKFFGQFYI